MSVLTKEQIVELIKKQKGLSVKEIEAEIRKIMERDGISEHAAAFLLAKELGIGIEEGAPLMHIEDLVPGMREVNIVGRVMKKFPPRTYTKRDGSQGKVMNLVIYDNTGNARVVIWDSQVDKYIGIQVGDVIKVIDAMVREGMTGMELHVNFRSRIIVNPEDPRVKEIPELQKVRRYSYTRKPIGELMDGDKFVEVRGTIAKLYRIAVYDACPQCRRKVDYDESSGIWICPEHGEVEPMTMVILDFGLDDGTGYIRATLFGDNATELLGADATAIKEKVNELVNSGLTVREAGKKLAEEEFYSLIGKEIIVRGNVYEDRFMGTLLKASSWDEVDYLREIERIRRVFKEVM
ncbi:replication factor A [Thermococci archaeon]|uniref:OB-fold nucleic acid binding domain-containing protein n=1 Tax=Palaeococcus sp. (in: euryarchaeotes) TaxID=2820298 RepID=UPI000F247238|nr:OB-fold nucleic acid binding domain-containing protein [Palaeococcus sp. (in: euryarchaeotes)]MCD6558469.1 replication factor A [Palaeococcus sp. (in: euryarchaeotes)]RLF77306.1 MAG: replication factor A [Thermococci archaeon]RLF89524.1 MAG: replication factor A [Thermococci archaeon]